MTFDAEHAALLVRATARVSAAILAVNFLVAARRVSGASSGTIDVRRIDVATFASFVVSHTIHFICVGLLTIATAGANIDARSGYVPVVALGVVFYFACVAVVRVKRRPSLEWADRRQRRTELWLLAGIWVAFFQAYAGRLLEWWLFTALAALLLYSVARFVTAALRSRVYSPHVRVS